MPRLVYDNFDGMITRIAPEKQPASILQLLHNYELAQIEGHLRKRKLTKALLTVGGATPSVQNIAEFVDANGGRVLVINDAGNSSLKESIYSGGYGAAAAISNDERGGGTITALFPVTDFKELRSGCGVGNSTDYPIWYGYIPERDRFNGAITITAGRYIEQQEYRELYDFGADPTGSDPPFYVDIGLETVDKTGIGLAAGTYTVFAAPVLDGYQRGFPTKNVTLPDGNIIPIHTVRIAPSDSNAYCLSIGLIWRGDFLESLKRVTAVDIFVAYADDAIGGNIESVPAYFLERIDLNADGKTFLEITGTTNSPANKITIATSADWYSFNPVGLFVYDIDNDTYHRVTGQTLNGADRELDVTPSSTVSGTSNLRFFSRWWDVTPPTGAGNQAYVTFFDNSYKKLSTEMFTHLRMPAGDKGIPDFRYKYLSVAGQSFLAVSFPDPDGNKF